MVLSPTGLSSSSPTVCRKNSPTSHSGLTRPSAVSVAAGTMSRNEADRNTSPSANFTGLDGWLRTEPHPHHAKNGDSRMTKSELSDWIPADGNAKPRTSCRES